MYCVRKVTNDLYWVGANDHRLALFENCFPIPRGVSYNAYCLLDEKTVLFDTVDWSACRQLWKIWRMCWMAASWTTCWSTIWSRITPPASRRSCCAILR